MMQKNTDKDRPLLIYDGDCEFCAYWARYWQKLTGESVAYAPYQEVDKQYPAIPLKEFKRAIQYIAPDGKIASAAEASFLTLSHAPNQKIWLWLYLHLPGFAAITEFLYAFIAAHRPAFYRISLWLWGHGYAPPQFTFVSWLFLRILGLVYLSAFASFGVQAMGLIGSHGILPLSDFIQAVENHFGVERYWLAPMVFWWGSSDAAIQAVCWGGAALSVLLILNVLPRINLILLYLLYLSLLYAGQNFMTFQWDTLLLEAGFLGLILSLSTKTGIWLIRWLIFRFMLLSGSVKLLSGDPTWANLTALTYHFQTQPLPTPLAWYAHHIPAGGLVFATAMTFVVELGLPWLIFFPRRLRFLAGFGFLLLEVLIFLTGNYNFFNILTMLICLPLFDDAALYTIMPRRLMPWLQGHIKSVVPHKIFSVIAGVLAALIIFVSCGQLYATYNRSRLPAPVAWVSAGIDPLHIVNTYGLFAVMTTSRPEIIIEGSDEGIHWKEYGFKYKPDDIHRALSWNIPHQPRLDWQLWFAALGTAQENPWMARLLEQILRNSQPVIDLLGHNPFPEKPPVYIRALIYDYTYASADEKKRGIWWDRKLLGVYFPEARLK
jgi:predicted DCC family thiol-disulfide oxidoreductase YuxK